VAGPRCAYAKWLAHCRWWLAGATSVLGPVASRDAEAWGTGKRVGSGVGAGSDRQTPRATAYGMHKHERLMLISVRD
jgi:hypothetical protein